MRTEVKIGIVVGSVVALLLVVYFAVLRKPQAPQSPQVNTSQPPTGSETSRPPVAPPRTERQVTPPPRREPMAVTPPPATAPVAATTRPAETLEEAQARQMRELPARSPRPLTENDAPAIGGLPRSATLTPPVRPPAAAQKTYTVVSGDNYWTIARKEYGDSKYAGLIQTANPTANPQNLQVGQKLILPPKPVETVAAAAGTATGTTRTLAGGEREYVVKAGDSGFWGIAQSLYGDGKHWPLIQSANPGVDPTALKIGSTLKIPPLPAGGTAASGTPSAPRRTPTAGQEIYKVAAGDSGFWGIAVKKYGDGTYYQAIARANPGVDPTRLRVGQELILPSKAEIDATISAARGGSATASSGGGTVSGRAVFD